MSTKKKVRPGAITLASDEDALLIEYEQEEFAVLEDGAVGELLNKVRGSKRLRVKGINETDDLSTLAHDLAERCKLIKPSAVDTVRALLAELQARPRLDCDRAERSEGMQARRSGQGHGGRPPLAAGSIADGQRRTSEVGRLEGDLRPRPPEGKRSSKKDKMSRESSAAKRKHLERERRLQMAQQERFQSQIFAAQARKYESATVSNVEAYMEQLYEDDLTQKVQGLGLVSHLFRNTANFEALLSQSGLMQLLARTLREEGKKSMDLAMSAVAIFFSISHFSRFHTIIMDNQVGAMTMDLIDLEGRRTALRTRESGMSPAEIAQKVMEASEGTVSLSEQERRSIAIIQKQDRLLYLSFYLLLNLAEDAAMERKMRKKGIVAHLVAALERSNVELLILAFTFLKKLSIFKENKDEMVKRGVIERIARFVPVRSSVLMMTVLRLLHNLSFDTNVRDDIVGAGLVPRLVDLIQEERFASTCMGLLYHVSMEDKFKSLFTYTQGVPIVSARLQTAEDLRQEPELVALAVNLTHNQRCATALIQGPYFDALMRRALQTRDDLLFKVLRNCGQVEDMPVKRKFAPYIEQVVVLLKDTDISADLFIEVLGLLANLNLPEVDFQALIARYDLPNFLAQYARPGAVDDDILLEVVMFVGVLCNESSAELIASAGLVPMLFHHMGERKDDDEFVLQITFTFSKLSQFEPTARALLEGTDILYYLVDLLQDKNQEVRAAVQIRKHADKALDVLLEAYPEQGEDVKALKFKTFNQEWLDVVEQSDAELSDQLLEMERDVAGRRAELGLYEDDEYPNGLMFDDLHEVTGAHSPSLPDGHSPGDAAVEARASMVGDGRASSSGSPFARVELPVDVGLTLNLEAGDVANEYVGALS